LVGFIVNTAYALPHYLLIKTLKKYNRLDQ
jgi:hypothetical protein